MVLRFGFWETTLRGKVDDVCFQVPCLVTEQLSEMIFGLEFLEKHHAYWDFTNRSIRLNGRAFPLQRQPKGGKCRKIVVAAILKCLLSQNPTSKLKQFCRTCRASPRFGQPNRRSSPLELWCRHVASE